MSIKQVTGGEAVACGGSDLLDGVNDGTEPGLQIPGAPFYRYLWLSHPERKVLHTPASAQVKPTWPFCEVVYFLHVILPAPDRHVTLTWD